MHDNISLKYVLGDLGARYMSLKSWQHEKQWVPTDSLELCIAQKEVLVMALWFLF